MNITNKYLLIGAVVLWVVTALGYCHAVRRDPARRIARKQREIAQKIAELRTLLHEHYKITELFCAVTGKTQEKLEAACTTKE